MDASDDCGREAKVRSPVKRVPLRLKFFRPSICTFLRLAAKRRQSPKNLAAALRYRLAETLRRALRSKHGFGARALPSDRRSECLSSRPSPKTLFVSVFGCPLTG